MGQLTVLNYIIINIFKGDVDIKNIYYVYIHFKYKNNDDI